ncbi:dynein axonemal light chain 4 [Cloeon dipterum]|uniref:Dynein light chain n=1 Tax=Cloeon dipterum TaxID=197152 RepID=A0A8S1C2D9_9INSE|nr:Hypothetical predicted protein [Cloeon dipterum]
MIETVEAKKEDVEVGKKIIHSHPLVRHCDMPDEMKNETIELCVTACEKHSSNNESAAKLIKETMDNKFGPSWHAVVGEGFGLEITHECRNLLYMFFAGNMAVCVWKCS